MEIYGRKVGSLEVSRNFHGENFYTGSCTCSRSVKIWKALVSIETSVG
jgi:hypothetical protein